MVTALALASFLTGTTVISAGIGFAIGAIVINLAIAAILGKILAPDMPKSGRDTKGIQNIIRSNIMPRRIIYGESVTGGPYALLETEGATNQKLKMIVVLSAHPLDDIIGVYIDDQYVNIAGIGGSTNTSSGTNDLDTNYILDTGKFGTGEATGLVKIIKNNGWGYADHQYVTDAADTDAINDRAKGTVIATDLTANWSQPSTTTRDSSTGIYTDSGHKLTNCAYIYLSFTYNRDVWSGFPKLKFHVRGKRLYNPEQDPTNFAAEGADSAGTHVLSDPDTYTWSEDWSLSILDYLLNTSYGLGAKITGSLIEIDWTEMIQSHLDSSALITNGLPSPNTDNTERYTTNGVLETNSTPISNIEALLTSGGGELIYAQGQYKLRPAIYRLPNSSTDVINEDMMVSSLSIRTHSPRSDIFNKAAGVFVDKGPNPSKPLFEPSDFSIVDPLDSSGLNPYEVIDDEEIIREFDYPFTTREFEAQRLARIQLERVRRGMTVSFEANLQVLQYSVGDTVYLEVLSDSKYANESFFNRLGLDDTVQNRPDSPFTVYYKQFKILDMQYTPASTIAVTMIEEAEEIYDWNDGDANPTPNALESEIIVDDPTGVVLPPDWLVVSPDSAIVEVIPSQSGASVTTLLKWNAADRGSLINAVDQVHISFYTLEYGIVTDPSLVEEARVDIWIAGGNKVSNHSQILQGPLALETLYKDGSEYDFRIRGVSYGGRRSAWTYYSTDVGSDYAPTIPPASSTDIYYILPTNGTAIKNGTGTLTVEARQIIGGVDTLMSSGARQLYVGGTTLVTVANGYTSPSDGYTGTFDTDDITGDIVVELRNGSGGTLLDTVTLVDIDDGLAGGGGADAYYGYIEATGGLAWTQATNGGAWNPTATTTQLDFTVVQGGSIVAQDAYLVTRDAAGLLTGSVATHSNSPGDFANSPGVITPTITGSGTQSLTVVFDYVNGADAISVGETVITSVGADDGTAGTDGITVYLENTGDTVTILNPAGTDYVLQSNPRSQFKILDGITDVTDTSAVTYSIIGAQPQGGLTGSISDTIGTKGQISITGTAPLWTTNTEWFQFRATYNAINYNLFFSMSKILKGNSGIIWSTTNPAEVITALADGTGYTLPTNPVAQLTFIDNDVDITDTTAVTYSVDSPDTKNGLTISVSDAIGSKGQVSLAGASPSWTSNSEIFDIRISYNGNDYVQTYSIAKAIAGTTGTQGATGKVGWGHDLVFSATDADTVAWTAGSVWDVTPTTFTISAGNTGNMTARTYIYLDSDVSTTVLQTTTNGQTAVGENKILVAVAEDTPDADAFFQVFGGYGGLLVSGNEIVGNTILANHISATFFEGRTFTGGTFQTRLPLSELTSPFPTTSRTSISEATDLQIQDENDSVIFSVTDLGTAAAINIVGDFAAGSLNTAQMFSATGIADLRGRLGVADPVGSTGGIATTSPTFITIPTTSTDTEIDVGIYNTGLSENTITFNISDVAQRTQASDLPYTAPTWDVNLFYSTGSPHTWTAVPGGDFTVVGTVSTQFNPYKSPLYTNSLNLNATRTVLWTPASPFATDDPIFFMVRTVKISGDAGSPSLSSVSASEAVVGSSVDNGTALHNTLRWNGLKWIEEGSVQIDASNTRLWIRDGWELWVSDTADTSWMRQYHDGTNYIFDSNSTTNIDILNGESLRWIIDSSDNVSVGLGGADNLDLRTTVGDVRILPAASSPTAIFASTSTQLREGVPVRFYGSGGVNYTELQHDNTDFNITHNGTTDWNITGITSIQAGTVNVDFAVITGTSYGGITEANLVDKSVTETIAGGWIFSANLRAAAGIDVHSTAAITPTTIPTALPLGISAEYSTDAAWPDGSWNHIYAFNTSSTRAFQFAVPDVVSDGTGFHYRTNNVAGDGWESWAQLEVVGHTHTGTTISALDAGDTTTGIFADARIPNLNASKITAGFLAVARGGTGVGTSTGTGSVVLSAAPNFTGTIDLAGGAVIQAPASAAISNQYNVTNNTFDVDMQYRIGGTLTALVRWDSSLNQIQWMDRDPSAVTQMMLNLETGALDITGACLAASFGGITSTSLVDRTDAETISGVWSFSGENTTTAGGMTYNDNVVTHYGTGEDVDMYFNGTDMFTDLISGADWRLRHITENMIVATANAGVVLYDNGVVKCTVGATGITVNGTGSSGVFRTNAQAAVDQITGCQTVDRGGTYRNVGLATMVRVNIGTDVTMGAGNWHQRFVHTNATSHSITFNTETNIPDGAVVWVQALTGALTLVQGSGVTITRFLGTGAPATGTATIALGGWATVVKDGDSAYHVMGLGMT